MRPRLLARAAIPGLHRMAPGPAGGWLAIKINSRIAQVYDKTLTLTHSTPIPATQRGSGTDTYLLEAGTTVGDDLIIIATAAGDHENHIVLSAPGRRYRARIDYPAPRGRNSLHPAGEAGRWLTRDYRSDVLELWGLDGAVNDEIPGQLVLANPPFGPDEQIAGQLPLFDV